MSGLPEGWEEATVDEISSIEDARRIPLNAKQRAEIPGDFPYYGANGPVGTVGEYLFEGDHVLLAEDGGHFDNPARGVAYEASGKFWVNNHAHILQSLGGVSSRFLSAWMNAIDWMPHVSGTTRLKLTQGSLRRITLPIPPLAEQKRIVAKLDRLSARSGKAKTHLAEVQTLATRAKQAILAAAFPSSGYRELNDVAVIKTGPFGSALHKRDYITSGIFVVNPKHINNGRIFPQDEVSISNEKAIELKDFLLKSGDIVLGRRGEMGRAALVSKEHAGSLCGTGSMILTPLAEIHGEYLQRFLTSSVAVKHLTKHSVGTTMVNLNQKVLKRLKVPVPSLPEQTEITRRIETAFAKIDRMASEASRAADLLERLDQQLLAKAFRGELVPQDPSDEPASALLARIREARANAPKPKRRRKSARA